MDGPLTRLGYPELSSRCLRVASGFASLGIKRGDRIGVILPNGVAFIEAWFAASILGAVFVPFNFALKGEMLAFQLEDSGISLLCVDSRLAGNLEAVRIPRNVKTIITAREGSDDSEHDILTTGVIHREMQELRGCAEYRLPGESGAISSHRNDQSDLQPAAMLYTSGTTGSPKGVVLAQRAYLNRTYEVTDLLGIRSGGGDMVFLNALPMFHTSGQVMTTLPAFLNGGTVVIEEWFHASRFWKIAAGTGARFSFLLMTMLNSLLKRKEAYVNSSLELILCGGASEGVWREFEESFMVKLLEGFGMTETCGIAIFNRLDDFRRGSIGKPLPSMDAKIEFNGFPEDEAPPETLGEICLRQKVAGTMMLGYHQNGLSEMPAGIAADWLRTGDVGYRDRDGYFYFVERKKDIIRRRGENIAPSDIERTVSLHPLVLEGCAIGEESELGEEEVVIYLVLKDGEKSLRGLEREFLEWLDGQLPFYMMPKKIRIVEALPKTANQKIQRARVREGSELIVTSEIDPEALGFKPSRSPLA